MPRFEESLVSLGAWLLQRGYEFQTVTPATTGRVLARPERLEARSVRDVLGWGARFRESVVPAEVLSWLREADAVESLEDGRFRSKVRFSTFRTVDARTLIFAHSGYPTVEPDAVFFGPDTVRFAQLLEQYAPARRIGRAIDLGTGSGAGGILVARRCEQVVLSDINERALVLARTNARLAGTTNVVFALGDLYGAIDGTFDWIMANPPYLVDEGKRRYREGGGSLGIDLAVRIVVEGLPRLAPGGRLVLYTGVPIVDGEDPLRAALDPVLERADLEAQYRERDPDVFGEELDQPAYRTVDRIAIVSLVIDRPL